MTCGNTFLLRYFFFLNVIERESVRGIKGGEEWVLLKIFTNKIFRLGSSGVFFGTFLFSFFTETQFVHCSTPDLKFGTKARSLQGFGFFLLCATSNGSAYQCTCLGGSRVLVVCSNKITRSRLRHISKTQ